MSPLASLSSNSRTIGAEELRELHVGEIGLDMELQVLAVRREGWSAPGPALSPVSSQSLPASAIVLLALSAV